MKNKLNNELAVCGFAAVKSLEKKNPDRITRLYFSAERAPLFGGLCKKLAARKAPYNQVKDISELERLSGTVHHQGVVAMIEAPQIVRLNTDIVDEWVEKKQSALLLDRVGNAVAFIPKHHSDRTTIVDGKIRNSLLVEHRRKTGNAIFFYIRMQLCTGCPYDNRKMKKRSHGGAHGFVREKIHRSLKSDNASTSRSVGRSYDGPRIAGILDFIQNCQKRRFLCPQ